MAKEKKTTYAMSRRKRNAIFGVCVLAVAVAVWLDRTHIKPGLNQGKAQTSQQQTARDLQKYHEKTFTVVKVVDGDTIDIDIADGKYDHTRIRLWGVDTPETKSPKYGVMYFGPQASAFTTDAVYGKEVTVYLEAHNTRGKYGRLLAYVQLGDGSFLNEVLVSEGYAYADSRFRHSYYHKYQQLQALAKGQKKGLWAKVTREQLPQWLQRKKPKLLKKK